MTKLVKVHSIIYCLLWYNGTDVEFNVTDTR